MKKINYSIKTLSPVVFAEQSGDAVLTATKRFIPGAVLRGALAGAYIRKLSDKENAHKDDGFRNLFLLGKARFLPAYPSLEKVQPGAKTIYCPLSFMENKQKTVIKDYSLGEIKPVAGFKKKSGFVIFDKETNTVEPVKAKVQIEFHMARNENEERVSGKSIKGKVFNYEYLEAFQYFRGSIFVDDDYVDILKQYLPETGKSMSMKLGRSRTNQYGMCELSVESIDEVKETAASVPGDVYLYTLTPYIPYSFDGIGEVRVDNAFSGLISDIESELTKAGVEEKIALAEPQIFASVESIDGYVGVWNMKRERVSAVSAGSLCRIDVSSLKPDEYSVLKNVLYSGFGDRTGEGYGQVRLWVPLEEIMKEDPDKEKADKKEEYIGNVLTKIQQHAFSAETRIMARKIMQQKMVDVIRKKAKDDSLGININPIGKTSLRRIEFVMDTPASKAEIIKEIKEKFHEPAQNNLMNISIGYAKVWEALTEIESYNLYSNLKWEDCLGLSEDKVRALKHILDVKNLAEVISDDIIYKEYWFWFARHAVNNKEM